MIQRRNYRACLKQHATIEELKKAVMTDAETVRMAIEQKKCLTVAMYYHEDMIFLYTEGLGGEADAGRLFPNVSKLLELWPQKGGKTPWVKMHTIYYHAIPEDEKAWTRQGKKIRSGLQLIRRAILIILCQVRRTSCFCRKYFPWDQRTIWKIRKQKIFHEASKNGGRVIIPAGEFLSGTTVLKSNIDFHLEKGATLISSLREEDILDFAKLFEDDNACTGWDGGCFLFACHEKNITISGEGVIYGQGDKRLPCKDR